VPACSRRPLACVEVGGGGVETVLLGGPTPVVRPGAQAPEGIPLLMAVPGIVEGIRVLAASNLGWLDVEPARALGLDATPALVLNDAEAAALGESALRGGASLTYVGLGTGVGGAVVDSGAVTGANLLGHGGTFGDAPCPCGRTGCLETVAAGWALPDPLPPSRHRSVGVAVATAVLAEPLATAQLVVVGGGLARRHPGLVEAVRAALPDRTVEASAAPPGVKSAAAWGLALAYEQVTGAVA
jgi:predicted NBD/HSP70 family sugar kinase